MLDGGLPAWLAAGGAVEAGEAAVTPEVFKAHFDPRQLRTLEQMKQIVDAGGEQVVDVREAERFSGAVAEKRPGLRAGHMPGSRNIPYDQLTGEDHRLKSPAQLMKLLAAAKVDLAHPVVTTCGGGVAAGILPAASRFGRFLGHSAIAGRRAPLARPITRPGTACFLAGTLVLNTTPDLAVPIESIAEGAVVASIYPAGTTCARIDGNTYTSTRRRIASERKIPKPDDAVQQHSADYRLPTQPRFRLMPSPKSSQARRRSSATPSRE